MQRKKLYALLNSCLFCKKSRFSVYGPVLWIPPTERISQKSKILLDNVHLGSELSMSYAEPLLSRMDVLVQEIILTLIYCQLLKDKLCFQILAHLFQLMHC